MGATKFCYSLKSRFSPLNSSASRCPSSEWKNCFQAETIRLRAPSLTINLHAVPFACFRGSRVWTVCVGLGFVCLRWVLCGWGGVGVVGGVLCGVSWCFLSPASGCGLLSFATTRFRHMSKALTNYLTVRLHDVATSFAAIDLLPVHN